MATLAALRFTDPSLALAALPVLETSERCGAIRLDDAAIVEWPTSSYRPTARHLAEVRTARPLSPSFWQLFFGAAFLLPVAARALGEHSAETGCSMATFGISDRFVRELRSRLVSGTSGLFLLTPDANADRVVEALAELDFSLFSTTLSRRQQGALLAAFGASSASATDTRGVLATESARPGS